MSTIDNDTVCAIATPAGRSGVGILRVSGPASKNIALQILGFEPTPRFAHYGDFSGKDGDVIDQGLALYFPNPQSFTGEDVLELQGHGGVHVLNALRDRVLQLGARLARPGEFSERAFLNNKIDLLQAEAIVDLIDASSRQAAKSAMRTLRGEFSQKIRDVVKKLIAARVHVEAAIDFSDEDIDILEDHQVARSLEEITAELDSTLQTAQQGVMLKEGINVVIAGKPNAGKSSLLNALSGEETAIVTDIPGTTRDVLSERLNLDGMPLNIVDTAGLRESKDIVELEGIKRAKTAIRQADQILLLVDQSTEGMLSDEHSVEKLFTELGLINETSDKLMDIIQSSTLVFNKIDLISNAEPSVDSIVVNGKALNIVSLSAKRKLGIDLLRDHLKACVGFNSAQENVFVARERHLLALQSAKKLLTTSLSNIESGTSLELVAEDLRVAQSELGSITGEFTSDDLLGEIFSTFCVGK